MWIRFDTKPDCDGQTDGYVTTISHSACTGMLTHDKKYVW